MNGRKTYYSFHDIPFKDRDNYDSGIQPSGIKFSRQEIFHIIFQVAVIKTCIHLVISRTFHLLQISLTALLLQPI